ncbi:MAG: Spermine/spermidine acetyltransferase [Bacteroidota bacterium]
MTIVLRKADASDAPMIAAMAHRIWRQHYIPIVGEAQVEFMLAKSYHPEALCAQMAEGQAFWLPETSSEVLGYLSVSLQQPGSYFLHKYYIDNGKRGKGLGKVILERLLPLYPDLRELRLTVNRQNFKSINFYFQVGFTIENCLDIPIGNGYEMNDFQMLLTLGGTGF